MGKHLEELGGYSDNTSFYWKAVGGSKEVVKPGQAGPVWFVRAAVAV